MKTIALQDAVAMIPDGASLMIGGFMGVGTPQRLVDELVRQGKRNLTVIANDNALMPFATARELPMLKRRSVVVVALSR